MVAVALLFPFLTLRGIWTLSITEVFGFVTGGICVWLIVRQHMWNWPVGLANNAVFFVLFLEAKLYADMGLQVVYFGLGVYGWWNWLRGGENHGELSVTRTRPWEWMFLAVFLLAGTWLLREILIAVNGAAPFWDGATTVLSLAAQYLLCRKRLENWFFWIMADVIYIPLYFSRGLPLTGALYAVFLVMCLAGLKQWLASMKSGNGASA